MICTIEGCYGTLIVQILCLMNPDNDQKKATKTWKQEN